MAAIAPPHIAAAPAGFPIVGPPQNPPILQDVLDADNLTHATKKMRDVTGNAIITDAEAVDVLRYDHSIKAVPANFPATRAALGALTVAAADALLGHYALPIIAGQNRLVELNTLRVFFNIPQPDFH